MREERASAVSMLFRLFSGVKTQEKIKITELERCVLTKAECMEVGI